MRNLPVYLKVMLIMNANSFLYYLGKLPIIKRLITPNLYKNTRAKLVFSFLGTLLDFAKATLAQTILVILFIRFFPQLLRVQTLGDVPSLGEEISLFIFLFCILPSFLQSSIFRGSKEDYTFLNYFSLNPNEYYRAKTGTGLVRQGISLLPVMLFLFQDFFISFSLIGVKLACMMLGNIYFLNQYKEKRKLGNVNIRLLVFLSAALLLYVGVYFDLIPKFYPSNQTAIVVSIISLVIVAIGWSYVVHYRNFKEISVQFAGKNVITFIYRLKRRCHWIKSIRLV